MRTKDLHAEYCDRLDRVAEDPKRALELLERVSIILGQSHYADYIEASHKIEAFLRGED